MKVFSMVASALCLAALTFGGNPAHAAEESWIDGPLMAKPDDPRPVGEAELEAFVRAIGVVRAAREQAEEACGTKAPEMYTCKGRMVATAVNEKIAGIDYERYVTIATAVGSGHYPELSERTRRMVRARSSASE